MIRKHVWRLVVTSRILTPRTHYTSDKTLAKRLAAHWKACGYGTELQRVSIEHARRYESFGPWGDRLELLPLGHALMGKTQRRHVLRIIAADRRRREAELELRKRARDKALTPAVCLIP